MAIRLDVKIKGETEVFNYLRKIQTTIPKAASKVINRYAQFVSRSAKARAVAKDRWAASGEMSRGIKVNVVSPTEVQIVSESRAAPFQEMGFEPHYVPISALSKVARDKLYSQGIYSRIRGKTSGKRGKKGFIFVKTAKPVISPAIDKANERLDDWIDEAIKEAIK